MLNVEEDLQLASEAKQEAMEAQQSEERGDHLSGRILLEPESKSRPLFEFPAKFTASRRENSVPTRRHFGVFDTSFPPPERTENELKRSCRSRFRPKWVG